MKSFFSLLLILALGACSSTRQTTLSSSSANQAMAGSDDQISFAKTTGEGGQANIAALQGAWYVHTMQRQEEMPEETLNLYINLNEDRSFVANTTCGQIKGHYALKGMNMTFDKLSYNRNDCGNAAQLDEMVRLLADVVNQYSFNGNMLFLKDKAGNNVFRITR